MSEKALCEVNMTYATMRSYFRAAERARQHLSGFIVFSPASFDKEYSVESRTYAVSSDNKAFRPNMGGYSIYASSLDGSDPCVRLEQYMASEYGGKNGWQIERCYMMSDEVERAKALMRLHVLGGGGCLVRNFGAYDAGRVTIYEDICATAKGYEFLCEQALHRGTRE